MCLQAQRVTKEIYFHSNSWFTPFSDQEMINQASTPDTIQQRKKLPDRSQGDEHFSKKNTKKSIYFELRR